MLKQTFRLVRKAKPVIKPVDVQVFREDVVKILTGPDKGLTGKVLEIYTESERDGPKVFVEGRNMRKQKVRVGGDDEDYLVVSMEAPLAYKDVQLLDPTTHQPVETMWMYTPDGQRVRVKKSESPTSADILPIAPQTDANKNEGLQGPKDTPYDVVQKVTYSDPTHNRFPLGIRALFEMNP